MNVDPSKGIGRALFSALTQLAQTSGHPELASAKLILLGFSGTGSLVGRLAEFAPDRVLVKFSPAAIRTGSRNHRQPAGAANAAATTTASASHRRNFGALELSGSRFTFGATG